MEYAVINNYNLCKWKFKSGREFWSILVVSSMRLMQSVPAVKFASEFPLLMAISTADMLDACPVLTVFPGVGLYLYLDFF